MLRPFSTGGDIGMLRWMRTKARRAGCAVMDVIHNYTLEIILISFISLGFCWGIGYFANALWGYKFELSSCWAGFSAIGGAGVLAAVKYCMDSWKNTPAGVAPQQGLSGSQRIALIGAEALSHYASNTSEEKDKDDKKERGEKSIEKP